MGLKQNLNGLHRRNQNNNVMAVWGFCSPVLLPSAEESQEGSLSCSPGVCDDKIHINA